MDILNKLYYDPASKASFSSERKLYEEANKQGANVSHRTVKEYLAGQIPYKLHRRIVRKYVRNPVIASRPEEIVQADLIDVQKYAGSNDSFRYILTLIDVFTKKAFAVPTKNKGAREMVRALSQIFKEMRPGSLNTDEGTEFTNREVQKFLKENLINYYISKNEVIKCSIVERFQRTLMTRIHKYFTAHGTNRYVDVLQDFIDSYNNTVHRSIRMAPNDVDEEDVPEVFRNLYGCATRRELLLKLYKKKQTVKEGDKVRIPEIKNIFAKGYRQSWTDRVYTVKKLVRGQKRPTFILEDTQKKRIPGKFYREEVQRINNADVYRVVIKGKRKRGRRTEYLIEYEGHPEEGRSWIPESQLQEIAS